MKIYAIQHNYGVSLFQAESANEALKFARKYFGSSGAPFRLVPNDVEWAQAMGAKVLNGGG